MSIMIFLLLGISYAAGSIIVEPRNAAVVAGEMMSMECRTDEESRVRKWDLLMADEEAFTVYSHGSPSPFHPEFTHFGVRVNASGSGILYTNSTRISDAGLYTCLVREGPDGKPVRVSAQLTVFESQPICETNLTTNGNKSLEVGNSIWFRCNVTFRGFWTPTVEWRQHSGTGNVRRLVADEVEIVRLPNRSVISTLTIKVVSSMKNVFFSCKTYFTEYDGKPFDDSANNIPNFSYSWNSEAVELPNYPVSGTVTDSSSILLVLGLSVFPVFVIIAVTVFCIHNRKSIRGRLLELVNTAGRTSAQLNQPSDEPQTSTELNPQTTTDVHTERRQMAAINEDYCSVTVVSQEPTVYCQLRLQDPPLSDYVNLPANQQKLTNEYPV